MRTVNRPDRPLYKTGRLDPRRRPQTARTTWRDVSACHNRPESWWDGDTDTTEAAQRTARGKGECLGCPVLESCLTGVMKAEGSNVSTRQLVRGGLTGDERVHLYLDSTLYGPADMEEARLLALESRESGRPVGELAEPGVGTTTVRMAERLLGRVPDARHAPFKAKDGSSLQYALSMEDEIRALRAAGLPNSLVGKQIGVGKETVRKAVQVFERLDREAAEDRARQAGTQAGMAAAA